MAPVPGFVFVHDESPEYLRAAQTGTRVTLPVFAPPWLVVDHSLERVLVTRWPGRLLRVEIVPPATDAERTALARAAEGLRGDAGYTRAVSVDVVEQLPVSVLFGPHGDAVCRVLDAGSALDLDRARRLGRARHPGADRVYSETWDRWLAGQPDGEVYRGGDHARLVAVPGAGPAMSPIGAGFSVLSHVVHDSARLRGGAGSHTVDLDGEEKLLEPWRTAAAALLDAAMAFGAPRLAGDGDAGVLTAAWNAVFGPPASGPDGFDGALAGLSRKAGRSPGRRRRPAGRGGCGTARPRRRSTARRGSRPAARPGPTVEPRWPGPCRAPASGGR